MKILLIFIDGFGLGKNDTKTNPIYGASPKVINQLLTGKLGSMSPTEVKQGMTGLPQSATGQTALLTGKKAAQILGRHQSGFPGKTLKKLIKKENIFLKLFKKNYNSTFANAYTKNYVKEFKNGKRRGSVTTECVFHARLNFRYPEDILKGRAVYQDFTNNILINNGHNLPKFSPERAAQNLLNITNNHIFTLYEYFQTDIIGHSQSWPKSVNLIKSLDKFISTILQGIDNKTLVIISSDHGNIEDLSVKTHTENKVPTIAYGYNHKEFTKNIKEISDITPNIISALDKHYNNKIS